VTSFARTILHARGLHARTHSCSQLLKYGKQALEYGKQAYKFLMGIPVVAEASKFVVAGDEAEGGKAVEREMHEHHPVSGFEENVQIRLSLKLVRIQVLTRRTQMHINLSDRLHPWSHQRPGAIYCPRASHRQGPAACGAPAGVTACDLFADCRR
jgi:hypothetical protein